MVNINKFSIRFDADSGVNAKVLLESASCKRMKRIIRSFKQNSFDLLYTF